MKILVLNGPNLNMLGKREEAFYGKESLEKIMGDMADAFPDIDFTFFQSNGEGELVDKIQQAEDERYQGIIINAGAYSHYSIAIRDALHILNIPKVEVHLSNIYAREQFRQVSVISAVCDGTIAGFGKHSYHLAAQYFMSGVRNKIGFGRK